MRGQAPDGQEQQGRTASPDAQVPPPDAQVPPPGAAGAPPGGPTPPFGPPGPPKAKRPSPLVWVAVGVAGVLVLAAIGVLVLQGRGPTGPVKAAQCVDQGFGTDAGNRIPASLRVSCDDAKAAAKVLKVTGEGTASLVPGARSEPDCPAGTDGVTNVRAGESDEHYYEACVRNLKGPHPGDPGAGGAFLSVGDCVSSGSVGFGKEQPCSKPGWYGKVIARVDTERSCPAQTLEVLKMQSFGGGKVIRPVLCLGPGGGVLAKGDCIEDPSFNVGDLGKADCGSQDAVAKVVGRVKTSQECPAEATNYLTFKGAYLPVLCLKKIRPTLNDRIRSLPG